jgi:DNA-binding FadR family transcriptional regulator
MIYHAIETHDASAAKEYMESHVAVAAGRSPNE